jgi:hypothetical protein
VESRKVANRLTGAKLESYYAALGRFVAAWADTETCLDLVVLASRPRRLFIQLSEKTRFIREVVAPKLSEALAKEALRLMDGIDAIAETRHDFVHGGLVSHTFKRSRLIVTLGRLVQPPRKPRRAPAKVTAVQLKTSAEKVRDLGDLLLDLTQAILREQRHN